jgi:copper resistance protein B
MKIRYQMFPLLISAVFVVGIYTSSVSAQDVPMNMPVPSPTPKVTPKPAPKQPPSPTPTPMQMEIAAPPPTVSPTPIEMNMPMPSSTPRPTPSPGREKQTLPNLAPGKDFPEPVADSERYGSTLVDVLEFRPGRTAGESDFRWDMEGSYGGDYNRFWYKSEGERNTAFKADYDIDLQLLYGRLISPYFNFQTGIRFETQTFRGANVTRPQAVVGLEGLLPYLVELESALFVDAKGNVSGRASLTKDILLTNRWIIQARFETNAAVQSVERFTTGRGMNNIETGARLRYEFSRRLAPYVGFTFDRSFFETAKLVRQEGGDPSQVRIAVGVRMLF